MSKERESEGETDRKKGEREREIGEMAGILLLSIQFFF